MMSSSSLIAAPKRASCARHARGLLVLLAAARSADPGAGLSWFVVWIPAAFALRLRRVSPPAEAPRCFSRAFHLVRSALGVEARTVGQRVASLVVSFERQTKRVVSRLAPRETTRARPRRARGPKRDATAGTGAIRRPRGSRLLPHGKNPLALARGCTNVSPDLPIVDARDFQTQRVPSASREKGSIGGFWGSQTEARINRARNRSPIIGARIFADVERGRFFGGRRQGATTTTKRAPLARALFDVSHVRSLERTRHSRGVGVMAASACAPVAPLLGAAGRITANRHCGGRTSRCAARTAAARVPRAIAVRAGESDGDVAVDRPDGPGLPKKWTRVMLKVSGEALAGEGGFGIDHEVVRNIAREVAGRRSGACRWRSWWAGDGGAAHEGKGLDRASADYMGMLATVMNAISMQAAVESHGVPTRVMTAFAMPEVAEPYVRRRAIRHLEKGRVVIFGAGTGNPFFTTDTGAAVLAREINAQCVLKATMVDGVYDSDPKRDPAAKLYESLTYETVQRLGLGVMDLTAITLCQENDIPVVVFNLNKRGNIASALRGNKVGTCVSSDVEKFERAGRGAPAEGGRWRYIGKVRI